MAKSRSQFRTRDQGFDTGTLPDPTAPENQLRTSGRGIYLMKTILRLKSGASPLACSMTRPIRSPFYQAFARASAGADLRQALLPSMSASIFRAREAARGRSCAVQSAWNDSGAVFEQTARPSDTHCSTRRGRQGMILAAARQRSVGNSKWPKNRRTLHLKKKASRSWPPSLPLVANRYRLCRWNDSPIGYSITVPLR
jgi:hypothetical protein